MPLTTGLPKKYKQEPKGTETKTLEIKPQAQNKPKSAKAAASQELVIDFPKEGEILRGPQYVVRISTTLAGQVEISIDGQAWKACRPSVGFWWCDWTATPGKHTLQLRVKTPEGKLKKSKVTSCSYPS